MRVYPNIHLSKRHLFPKESAMSTVLPSSSTLLGLNPSAGHLAQGTYRARRRFDGSRGLAAMLLAAVVAALVVLADQMISSWADGHLFLGWVALWVVVFAGLALFADKTVTAEHATVDVIRPRIEIGGVPTPVEQVVAGGVRCL